VGFANGLQNFAINAVDSDGYDNELGRLDVNLSSRNRLSFDARHNYRAQNKNQFFNNAATGNFLYRINQGAGVDDVYTISPTVVMNIRAQLDALYRESFLARRWDRSGLAGIPRLHRRRGRVQDAAVHHLCQHQRRGRRQIDFRTAGVLR
jgi:hypothetical protein